MFDKLKENVQHLPTTLAGLLVFLAALPQDPTIAHILSISPSAAKYISGIGGVAAGLVLIFGLGRVK
jgi:hypothetical protein